MLQRRVYPLLKKTLVAYIDELNQRVPELSLAYNEQTGELTKNVDAIKRVIEERKRSTTQACD